MNIPSWIPLGKKVYLFDVNGVLVREDRPFSVIYAERVGLPKGSTDVFFRGIFQKCLVGEADLKEEIAQYLPEWKWNGSVDEYLRLWFSEESEVNEEMYEIVKQLHEQGECCYFVTNQEKYRTQYLAKDLGLEKIVSGIFSSNELGAKKPDLDFYERVLDKMNYKGNMKDVFFLDDDMKNIESGREIGFDTFYYKA